MISIVPIQFNETSLAHYVALFAACFPHVDKFSYSYLKWLYCDNPAGAAVGFDAWDGDVLAAHYVCVPALVSVGGVEVRALLSLNTATHPTYQGQGLFTKLAEKTYDEGARIGFDCVYGIANSNSTPGFVKKLGFSLVAQLEAQVGFGSLNVDFESAGRHVQFERVWSAKSFAWRCANPVNAIRGRLSGNVVQLYANGLSGMFPAYAELPSENLAQVKFESTGYISPCRLFIGLIPLGTKRFRAYWDIPHKFRPSPLNFIYRSLSGKMVTLEPGLVSLSFLDFDAY